MRSCWGRSISKVASNIRNKKVDWSSDRSNPGEIGVVDGVLFKHHELLREIGCVQCIEDDFANDLTCSSFDLQPGYSMF